MFRIVAAILILLALPLAGCNKSPPATKPSKRASGKPTAQTAATQPHTAATTSTATGETDRDFDARYITDDCFAALILHPRRIVQAPALRGLPLASLLSGPMQRLGLPLDQIDQTLVALAPLTEGDIPDAPFAPLTIVRFHSAVTPEKVAQAMWGEFETSSRDGRTWLRQAAPPHMTACFADLRTMLVSTAPRVEQMLAADGVANPLAGHLQSADVQCDLLAVLMVEPIRPSLAPLRQHLQAHLPPVALPLFDVAQHARSAMVRADLQGPSLLRLEVEPIDADARTKVEEQLRGLDQAIRMMFSALKDQAAQPLSDPTMPVFVNLGSEVVSGTKIGSNKDRVTMNFPKPASFDRLGEDLREAIEAAEFARQRSRALQAIPSSPERR